VFKWMKEAGLETWIDQVGNVRGRLNSNEPGAKTFVIASHIDTVINAGKFDGPLGVLMGLDLLEQLIQKELKPPFNIELIAFCDEEGVRFHTTFLGSKVVAGTLEIALLEKQDDTGKKLWDVIRELGGDVALMAQDAIPREKWLGYFEIHIEQGPVLYNKHLPAAAVSAIAGQVRAELRFSGTAGHAGTVPMALRKDALCCAAECILEIERFARAHMEIVATTGKLNILHAASNVIPGEVHCSLDLRSDDMNVLTSAEEHLRRLCETICADRKIEFEYVQVQVTPPVTCDERLHRLLKRSIEEAGFESLSLVSGAGHDGIAISAVAPVCMLFVRCYKGISHHPRENVEAQDLCDALRISENFIHHLVKNS
jgi:allantoate deiminase